MQRVSAKDQDSLAPVSLDGVGFDEELARLHAGQGVQLWKWLSLMAVLGLLAVVAVRGMEAADTRDRAWAAFSYLNDVKLDGFLNCALPRARPVHVSSRDHLHSLMERHLQPSVSAYGQMLESCLPELREFERGLARMPVPSEATHEQARMVRAATAMYEHAHTLADALSTDPDMDFVQSTGLIDRFTSAHERFRKAHEKWNAQMAF